MRYAPGSSGSRSNIRLLSAPVWTVKGIILRVVIVGFFLWLWIHLTLQYSGSDSYGLVLKCLAVDMWWVPGSMACSKIVFRPTDTPARNFEQEWAAHFQAAEVLDFKNAYLRTCSQNAYCAAAVISSGRLESPGTGLASNVNFALTVFLLSNASLTSRTFRLYVYQWNYVSWSALFRDFTTDSPCQIVRTVDVAEWTPVNQTFETFQLQIGRNGEAELTGGKDVLRELNSEHYIDFFFDIRDKYEDAKGRDETFRRKSILARALLDLQPELFAVVKQVWTQLTESGGYLAVHIRRGDKVAMRETPDFPLLFYVRTLRRVCHTNTGQCSRTVFVSCDDPEVCRQFEKMAQDCFQVTNFRREVEKAQLAPWFNSSSVVFRDQKGFNSLPAADRLQSAKEMVINIYLAAMADFVVCTYSSNICRLVALLKNGTLSDLNVSSLDWPYWTMI
ncbi:hypothetical protein RvY_15050 [Ramazzottius varieornatus]|uniref:Peptide-O-fucosyltransferase n=1 Tax=Ramazzottius varieornatus TaxID=947166 RepID=A0A1D1VTH9_RAMVA|nr:hypothetical protein RvY_15050 [Ramazzottius varieornatus]